MKTPIEIEFRQHPLPYRNLIVDLVEFKEWWTVRLYRHNFEEFATSQKDVIALWVSELMNNLSLFDTVYLEVYP